MPYDSSKDEQIFSKSLETDLDRITVSIYSYNRGIKKMQISRENKNEQNEFRFAKLGRLTKEEAEAIIPLMQEALEQMD
ncbi:MAG: hypothetical protein FJZ11_02190 [Candidatus Omnitrophica bacterium]|nr:hypothetical protein [Candidatus Omnitrophota bacterium]